MRRVAAAALLALASAIALTEDAAAHIGSPDVYFEGTAGAYRLLVVVRMPRVIPGVADLEIRSLTEGLRELRVTPMRIRGLGSELPPVADMAERTGAPGVYRAQLWLMQRGAWKVHLAADGDSGPGELSVPVGAVAFSTRPMQRPLAWILGVLAALLVGGAIAIAGATVREAMNRPGVQPSPARVRNARAVMAVVALVCAAVVVVGRLWWRSDARETEAAVYRIPQLRATLSGSRTLSLAIGGAIPERSAERFGIDDLVPDHGHLMHLFLIREPGMDFLAHLHPIGTTGGMLVQELPSMPEGRYRVFGDIVHGSGFPETATSQIELPQIVSGLPDGDDSLAPASSLVAGPQTGTVPLTMGGRMVWVTSGALHAREPLWLKFRVEDSAGAPVTDLEPYMGMAGHLVVARVDWQVFAHLHPAGSAPMASIELANNSPTGAAHAGHAAPASEITFPYGFPLAGHYRMFVQIKRRGRIETGVFDAQVD